MDISDPDLSPTPASPRVVAWRRMVFALVLGVGAAVPAAVFVFLSLTFVALSTGWCEQGCATLSGRSDATSAFIPLLLCTLVVAAVMGGVMLALRRLRHPSATAIVGLALGIGVTGGAAGLFVDTSRGVTAAVIAATAAWLILWIPAGRWWLTRQRVSRRAQSA